MRFGTALLALAMIAATAGVVPARADDEAARLQRVLDELAVMEVLLSGKLSEPTRRELQIKLGSVRDGVVGVQQDLLRGQAGGTTAGVTVGTPAGPVVSVTVHEDPEPQSPEFQVIGAVTEGGVESPFAMDPPGFQALLAAIAAESFDDEKLAVLREACRHNHFFVDQVLRIVPLFTFSDGKVDAAAALYPRVIDPENFFQVYGAFDFDADKEELRKRLGL